MILAPALPLLTLALVALAARPAQAFSDLERFDHPSEQGGGGGRYFTGAPNDGFSCSVCHQGGEPPEIHINGLPLDGYRPQVAYEVEISWAESETPYALHLEAVDRTGAEAGLLNLLNDALVDARGRCNGDPEGRVAASLIERDNRRILAVEPCGATAVRFQLIPSEARDMFFSAGLVRSDKSGRPSGDGAAELRYVLNREDAPKTIVGGSCSAFRATAEEGASYLGALGFALAAALVWRRARERPNGTRAPRAC